MGPRGSLRLALRLAAGGYAALISRISQSAPRDSITAARASASLAAERESIFVRGLLRSFARTRKAKPWVSLRVSFIEWSSSGPEVIEALAPGVLLGILRRRMEARGPAGRGFPLCTG